MILQYSRIENEDYILKEFFSFQIYEKNRTNMYLDTLFEMFNMREKILS